MAKIEKTPRELVDDVAEIPDEILNELPHWARVLRDLCREARAQILTESQIDGQKKEYAEQGELREPEVEERVRQFLQNQGYTIHQRLERTGPDILALSKDGRKLLVEVKGDRPGHESSPGTINVDVMTLLGQILHRKGRGLADDYAIAIRPVHLRLIKEAAPALKEISVRIFIVNDTDVQQLE